MYLRQLSLISIFTISLVSCGGSSSNNSPANNTPTPTQIAALTAAEISTYSDNQISALGVDIRYLSDAALQALTYGTNASNPVGQIQSISASQISALTPAQVRMIGAAGPGGSVATSQIQYLNSGAWSALASDPAQVSAITPAEIETLWDSEIVALGANIQHLSNAALNALSYTTLAGNAHHSVGQIESLTVAQIAALSPAQVRILGAAGPGGSVTTSQIQYLNSGAWAALVSDPLQVAAITPAEIPTLWDSKIVAIGANIQYLSDASLNALTYTTLPNANHVTGQIESLSVSQIAALSPAQIRMLGAAGVGGSVGTPQLQWLNSGAWGQLVSDPTQVAAITAAEVATLWDWHIASLGVNIAYLSDAALGALSVTTTINAIHPVGQIETLSAQQIAAFTPAQFSILANIVSPYGAGTAIAWLNTGAFGSINAAQIAVLTPSNVVGVSASQLATLSTTALAGLATATAASFTAGQTSNLSAPQHTACGC